MRNSNIIDVVAQDAAGNYVLFMVQDRAWASDPEQVDQLRQKFNAYAGYILGGELSEAYPETSGSSVYIQLDCVEEPDGEIRQIIDFAARQLEQHGIDFRLNVRS